MKQINLITTMIVILATMLFTTSCEDKIEEKRVYKVNVAKYMTYDDMRKSVKISTPLALEKPGKIYVYRNMILINEVDKGIHVYDNSNPAKPQNITFIEIPGNYDIAVKDNKLFADSYVDLVVFDVTDLKNVQEVGRLRNIFDNYYNYPQPEENYPCDWGTNQEGIIVGWEVEERTEEIEYTEKPGYFPELWKGDIQLDYYSTANSSIALEASVSTTGTAGSMARFRIYQNYIYIAKDWQLKVIDIKDINNPIEGEMIYTSINVETVFIAKDKLFIGATTGMLIYDLIDPALPKFISMFAHVNSCDPVVVDNKYAYVTLRSGNACQSFTNQLDVVNIQDLKNPFLEKTYPMENPHGLGVDDNLLFICDGDAGLKIYDKTDVYSIDKNMIEHYKEINAYDVIPMQGVLVMIGTNGLYQYDYTDIKNISLLSKISTSK